MAAARKLQSEIQQTLKKVDEGVLIFDEIWDKVYSATQQTLKEKYESDLKKEIKKLQRLRDQIKTWLSSSDIKDKNALLEARKTIEGKMEQFKVCEKDTKTKAFSKEGLAREAKLDPKEVLKEEKRNWVNECLERLSDLINTVEADEEKILSAKGKPSKAQKEMLEKLRNRMIKHKWHETRLELIIRLLDSDDLDPARLDDVKDSLEYYLESANEDDGAVNVEDEFDIYEELELDSIAPEGAVEAIAAKIGAIDISRADEEAAAAAAAKEAKDAADAAEAEEKKKAAAKAKAAKAAPVTSPPSVPVVPKTLPPGKTAASVVAASLPAAPSLTPAAGAKATPALAAKPGDAKKATTASGATNVSLAAIVSSLNTTPSIHAEDGKDHHESATTTTSSSTTSATPVSWATAAAAAANQPSPASTAAAAAAVASTTASKAPTPAPSATATPVASTAPTPPAPSLIRATSTTASATVTPATPALSSPVPVAALLPAPASAVTASAATTAAPVPAATTAAKPTVAASPVVSGLSAVSSPAPSQATPSVPASPAPSLLSQQQQPPPLQQKLSPEMMNTLSMLKQSMFNAPETLESDKLPSYTPRNYYQHTHPSYPTVPLFATQAENTAWFERLPMDTLFFVFYFQQGTYQQYLAAKQLKKHSWRFHKKYMTWFQRHEEPKIATEEYEEGTYVYFDYESGWCQRIKSEFKFEYAYLEDELSSNMGGGGGGNGASMDA